MARSLKKGPYVEPSLQKKVERAVVTKDPGTQADALLARG